MKNYNDYKKASDSIQNFFGGGIPPVAVVLGSGFGGITEKMTGRKALAYTEIPGFPRATNPNHEGVLYKGVFEGIPVLFLSGRFHGYEGYSMSESAFYVRVLHLLGVEYLILTNAAGSLDPKMKPGSFMIIRDHIKLCAESPLVGPHIQEFGERFADMTHCYDKECIKYALETAKRLSMEIYQGVYFYFAGPQYETPAEIRAARLLGADAVGMSTVPEAIAARSVGMRVMGISCITNMGAGMTENELRDTEVAQTAGQATESFAGLLTGVLQQINLL